MFMTCIEKRAKSQESKEAKREVDLPSLREMSFLHAAESRGLDMELCALSVKLLPSPRAIYMTYETCLCSSSVSQDMQNTMWSKKSVTDFFLRKGLNVGIHVCQHKTLHVQPPRACSLSGPHGVGSQRSETVREGKC